MSAADPFNLQRFVDAQRGVIDEVLAELRAGAKRSHWMWFVFPQLRQLGRSSTAQFYGVGTLDEARAYLQHPVLGSCLRQCVEAVLPWCGKRSPEQIFGPIDTLKLRSSLTLFDVVEPAALCEQALLGFFDGTRDDQTLALLRGAQ